MEKICFRTEIQPFDKNIFINHRQKLLFLGSCFAENIGEKLIVNKFNVLLNPFGILFNPASIAQSINFLISKKEFFEEELINYHDQWLSFNHHSNFYHDNKQDCLNHINTILLKGKKYLYTADYILITLGSSIVYRLKSTNCIVANCHKFPSESFNKTHLTSTESTRLLTEAIGNLRLINPSIKIIFTLSPVRYIKDDFIENSLSKANLRVAINELQNKFSDIFYFPAYEIMMDDLRDYRFYNQDLIHPSPLAIDYIWHYFSQSYFNSETLSINSMVNDITHAYQHRLKNPESEESKKFKKNSLTNIIALITKYQFLNFEKEISYFTE